MNRRSGTGFVARCASRLLAKLKGEVPAWLVLGFIAAYVALATLSTYRAQEARRIAALQLQASDDNAARLNDNDLLRTLPGVIQPAVFAPRDVPWKGDDEVVGVTVNGRARAYLVDALSRPDHHVINDVIGSVPVSITYCNINRCARAFTREGSQAPLDIAVGGQHNLRELLLLVDGTRFHQSTLELYDSGHGPASFPYQNLPLTVTTWKQWKELHPETEASMPQAPTSTQLPKSKKAR